MSKPKSQTQRNIDEDIAHRIRMRELVVKDEIAKIVAPSIVDGSLQWPSDKNELMASKLANQLSAEIRKRGKKRCYAVATLVEAGGFLPKEVV